MAFWRVKSGNFQYSLTKEELLGKMRIPLQENGYFVFVNENPYDRFDGEPVDTEHLTIFYSDKLDLWQRSYMMDEYLRQGYCIQQMSQEIASIKEVLHFHCVKILHLTPTDIMNKIRDKVIEMSAHKPHEQLHLLDVEKKILLLKEDASECLRIAGFLHDIDRCTERQLMNVGFANYAAFKNAHAMVSAEIAYEIVLKISKDEKLSNRVRELIQKHEVGGDEQQNILMDADSLSFFDVNLAGYKLNHTPEDIQAKIDFMKDRMDKKGLEILSVLFPNI